MSLVWLVVGVAIFAIVVRQMARRHERGRQSDLGFVSHSWLAEHRVSQMSDRHS
jgi:hypothetical protein